MLDSVDELLNEVPRIVRKVGFSRQSLSASGKFCCRSLKNQPQTEAVPIVREIHEWSRSRVMCHFRATG